MERVFQNLLSEERSFTKKGLFCFAKELVMSREGIGNHEGGF